MNRENFKCMIDWASLNNRYRSGVQGLPRSMRGFACPSWRDQVHIFFNIFEVFNFGAELHIVLVFEASPGDAIRILLEVPFAKLVSYFFSASVSAQGEVDVEYLVLLLGWLMGERRERGGS